MDFYLPIIVTVLLTFPQTYFAKKGYILYALILALMFSISIMTYLKSFDFVAYAILGNMMFYLMVFAAYLKRPRFKTKEE
jgi:hypothetical protein